MMPVFLKKAFWKLIKIAYSIILIIIFPILSLFYIRIVLKYYKKLLQADIIVYMPNDAGFGHTITLPDVQRRLFKGQNNIFIAFIQQNRHNPKLSLLWNDITVIIIPLNFKIKFFNFSISTPLLRLYSQFVIKIVMEFIKRSFKKSKRVIRSRELYDFLPKKLRIDVDRKLEKSYIKAAKKYRGMIWPMYYFNLIKNIDASKVRIPVCLRERIYNKLLIHVFGSLNISDNIKICSLYLRQKGYHHKDTRRDDYNRSGSSIDSYLDGIKLIIDSGYIVLVSGDVLFPTSIIDSFNNFLIDYRQLKVEKDLFDLYSKTEAEIAIIESGGGAWLPMINKTPSLVLNAFPYGYGMPYATVYYKTCFYDNGKFVPYNTIFNNLVNNLEVSRYKLRSNSKEQVYIAIKDFLDNLYKPREEIYEFFNSYIKKVPNFTWLKQSEAMLSPEWLKLYEHI